ncbi:MAG TPA: glycosyltransferase family 39 protein [Phycisphaerae bacterium]|nr:glycosyltransferase family 39 protein [Phycisphaerae bacterium]
METGKSAQKVGGGSVPARMLRRAPGLLNTVAFLSAVLVIVLVGWRQIPDKLETVRPVKYVGHADDASYALMGQSISEGRGISVPYVSTFYIPYPQTIYHREDHWPPFMGMSIAPVFYFAGKSALNARLPAIFYGSIGLPLATAFLTYALTRRGYAAIAAGLLMMANLAIYDQSLRVLSDISAAMLVALFCGSVLLARRHPWLHLHAGAAAAMAYYSKGSELLLLTLYPLMALFCCGPRTFARPWLYCGIATALLLLAPFWYGNWRDYGNPLHSTQNYVAGFFGFEEWDTKMYFPYWGKDLPDVSDRWTKYGNNYRQMARGQLAEGIQLTLSGAMDNNGNVWTDFGVWGLRARDAVLGNRTRWPIFGANPANASRPPPQMKPVAQWVSPIWELAGAGSVGLLLALVAGFPILLGMALWRRVRKRHAPPVPAQQPVDAKKITNGWMLGPVLSVMLVATAHLVFIAYLWLVTPRFLFPVLPLVLALGTAAAVCAMEWPLRALWWAIDLALHQFWRMRDARPQWFRRTQTVLANWPAVTTLVAAAIILCRITPVHAWQEDLLGQRGQRRDYPGQVDNRFVSAGAWIGKNFPSAIVMCRNPWELQFYMGPQNKSVGLPYPQEEVNRSANQIFAIARYYGVTHLLVDDMRPALAPYYLKRKPGLTRVPGCPGIALFAIDWSKIPKMSVEEALGRTPLPPTTQK